MRWRAGVIAAGGVVALVTLGLGSTRPPARVGDRGIRVVAGGDRPAMVRPAPVAVSAAPLPTVSATVGPAPAPTDGEALSALFDGQQRDPSWALGAEAAIASRLPVGAGVRCAEFMCRIAMPYRADAATETADEQANRVSRDWPHLSYNRLTAAVLGERPAAMLVFYATRTADGIGATVE